MHVFYVSPSGSTSTHICIYASINTYADSISLKFWAYPSCELIRLSKQGPGFFCYIHLSLLMKYIATPQDLQTPQDHILL